MFQRTLLILVYHGGAFVTACQPVAPAAPEPAILTLAAMTRSPSAKMWSPPSREQHGVKLQFLTLGGAVKRSTNSSSAPMRRLPTSSSASTTPS